MSARNDGGPAFPHVGEQFNHDIGEREIVTTSAGMTLRDYFAAKAMQAYVSSYPRGEICDPELIAQDAYGMADAMLEERNA